MCTRVLYETGTGTFITGRSMDWNDPTAQTDLWVFPKQMVRDGGQRNKAKKGDESKEQRKGTQFNKLIYKYGRHQPV